MVKTCILPSIFLIKAENSKWHSYKYPVHCIAPNIQNIASTNYNLMSYYLSIKQ